MKKQVFKKAKPQPVRPQKKYFKKKLNKEESASIKKAVEAKKEQRNQQFPNIYRFIAEHFKKSAKFMANTHKHEGFWVGILAGILGIAIVYVSLDINKNLLKKQKAEAERVKIFSEIKFWENTVQKYKGYRDAYFKLALLEYKIGNLEKSNYYLQKTLEIDPNFEPALKFKKSIYSSS